MRTAYVETDGSLSPAAPPAEVVKREMEATIDKITRELQEAFKG